MAEEQAGQALTVELTGTERAVRATLDHHVLRFNYAGHARIVEPQLVGIHENGEPLLVAFQTGGTSGTGAVPGWRTFRISEMEAVEIGEESFPGLRLDFLVGRQQTPLTDGLHERLGERRRRPESCHPIDVASGRQGQFHEDLTAGDRLKWRRRESSVPEPGRPEQLLPCDADARAGVVITTSWSPSR